MMLNGEINIETVTILNRITDFTNKTNINEDDIFWNDIKFILNKYAVFFPKDIVLGCKKTIKEKIK